MSKILRPRKRRLNDTEKVALPVVKCSVCGNLTTQGLHQIRLKLVRKGFLKKDRFGKWIQVPPVMKREDIYMCANCVKKGEKWRGTKPI